MKTFMLTLLIAIRAVESTNGLTSHNQYQIRDVCVQDVNRIYNTHYTMHNAYNHEKSKEIAILYLTYWGNEYVKSQHRIPTDETYARIWNGGPNGWKKKSTKKYWNKVKKHLNK